MNTVVHPGLKLTDVDPETYSESLQAWPACQPPRSPSRGLCPCPGPAPSEAGRRGRESHQEGSTGERGAPEACRRIQLPFSGHGAVRGGSG